MENISALEEAIILQDTKNICSLDHSIKGSAATVSLLKKSEIAKSIETAAANNELDEVKVLFGSLSVEYEKIQLFISQSNWIQIARQQHRKVCSKP